jgi:Bacterial SH3 domain
MSKPFASAALRSTALSGTARRGARVTLLAGLLLSLSAPAVAQGPAPATTPTVLYGPGMNLITNPGHEHPGAYFAGRGEINVTWDWVPYWEESPPGTDPRDQYYRTPEFRPPFKRDYPERVKSGGGSDRWFNYFALNKKTGIMQYVAGVPYGAPIRFTSWLQLWSSNDNLQPARSTNDGNLLVRVCIDQDGGPRDMNDPELKCSDWAQPYDKWAQITVDAVAKNNVVNVLIWSTASIPVEHNDIYADESCFEILTSATDKGICAGAGLVPTAFGVQPLPPNYASIKSQATSTAAAPQPTAPAGRITTVKAPAVEKPAVAVNTSGNLNVRETPRSNGKVLGKTPRGAVLDVLGRSKDGKWYQVNYKGAKGWVSAGFVLANALAKAAPIVP